MSILAEPPPSCLVDRRHRLLVGVGGEGCTLFSMNQKIHLQIWISPERVGEKTGCLAFIGISRPYFAITNKTRVQLQGSKIRNKFKN